MEDAELCSVPASLLVELGRLCSIVTAAHASVAPAETEPNSSAFDGRRQSCYCSPREYGRCVQHGSHGISRAQRRCLTKLFAEAPSFTH